MYLSRGPLDKYVLSEQVQALRILSQDHLGESGSAVREYVLRLLGSLCPLVSHDQRML